MPGAARAGNTGREDGPSLLIRPWPVDILYHEVYSAITRTTRAPARMPNRRVIHNSRQVTTCTNIRRGPTTGVCSRYWRQFERQRPRRRRRQRTAVPGLLPSPETGAPARCRSSSVIIEFQVPRHCSRDRMDHCCPRRHRRSCQFRRLPTPAGSVMAGRDSSPIRPAPTGQRPACRSFTASAPPVRRRIRWTMTRSAGGRPTADEPGNSPSPAQARRAAGEIWFHAGLALGDCAERRSGDGSS